MGNLLFGKGWRRIIALPPLTKHLGVELLEIGALDLLLDLGKSPWVSHKRQKSGHGEKQDDTAREHTHEADPHRPYQAQDGSP